MRLSLRQIAGPKSGKHFYPYYLEHGRMTIGRALDCTLQLEDPERAVSKHHCTIERASDGFLLRDESAVGTSVDGVKLQDGETVQLSSGSVISVCGFEFRVGISGEGAPDMVDPGDHLRLSDEIPTISSILADVAPGGHMASGMLPGSAYSGFIDIGPPPGSAASIRSNNVPSSRNVTIGWEGPPTIEKTDNVGLPDDWNDSSTLTNELEHRIATNTMVRLRSRDTFESEEAQPEESQTEAAAKFAAMDEALDATAAFRKHRLESIAKDAASESATVAVPEFATAPVPERVEAAVPEFAPAAIPEPIEAPVPEPATAAIPESVEIAVPELATVAIPEPVELAVPEFAPRTVPEPVRVVVPELTMTAIPEPVRVAVPEFATRAVPEPVRPPVPEPAPRVVPEPVRAAVPEPVRVAIPDTWADEPEPVRAAVVPEPVRAAVPEPVARAVPEPIIRTVAAPAAAAAPGQIEFDADDLLLSMDESASLLEQRVRFLENLFYDFLAKYETEVSPANNNVMYGQRASAASLAARLDVLGEEHTRLYSAIDNLLAGMRSLEPAAIEAKVTLGEARDLRTPSWLLQFPLFADSTYWRFFKSNFQRGSKSMLEFFREALRKEFEAATSRRASIESEESEIYEG